MTAPTPTSKILVVEDDPSILIGVRDTLEYEGFGVVTARDGGAGLKLALKGKRNGYEVDWAALVSGDAALAAALNASLEAPLLPKKRAPATSSRKAARKRKPLPGRS